ncbi:hypothetical protein A9Q78_00640 [Methylophaga sp. 41_12_T18]|nr:hypothetical protein A9Q78_00640 [Methylophaga sp. 41_12_T18]
MMHSSTETLPTDTSIDTIREQAVEWVLRLEDASKEELRINRVELGRWFAEDERHRQVFEQMQSIWSAPEQKISNHKQSKKILANIGMLAVVGIMILQMPWAYWTANHHSGIGEIQTVKLDDGTKAMLNTNSAINIKFDGKQRQIELVRGEVMVTVAKDLNQRPFTVVTLHGKAKAMGTIYSTRLHEQKTVVKVFESQVKVTANNSSDEMVVRAGESASVDATKVIKLDPVKKRKPDWAHNKLLFNNASMEEVVARLNDYRLGTVSMSTEVANRNLRFTGLLPAQDSDAALNIVADSLGLKLTKFTDYRVWFKNR